MTPRMNLTQYAVSVGLPTTQFEPPEPREAQFQFEEWYRWAGGEAFRFRFDANPSREKGQGV